MSLLFHRSLFGVFDIFLAIAGTAAGAYLYTQMLRRRQANHKTWMALPSSPSKGKKRSSKSIRRVYSKKGSDSKSPSPKKKSGRSRPVKSTVVSPKGGTRLRTPAGQPAVVDPQYQSLNDDASKQESSKKDSPENPDTPDNSSR